MPMEKEPVVGAMYEDEDGKAFEVLSFDEDIGTIEVQYEDGSVAEIDIDAWYEMELESLKTDAWKEGEEDEDEDDDKPPSDDDDDDEDEDDDDLDDDYEDSDQ